MAQVKFAGIAKSSYIFADGVREYFGNDGIMIVEDSTYVEELRKAQRAHGQIIEITEAVAKARAEVEKAEAAVQAKAEAQEAETAAFGKK